MASRKFPKEILVVRRADNCDAPFLEIVEPKPGEIENGEIVAVYELSYTTKARASVFLEKR